MGSLGKYNLIEELGSGSMGTVYLARDTVLDRKVALKTIRTGNEVDEEVRERFYREAKTCARLQHPSIVSVYDLGEQADYAYIAMELLLGSDLKKHIEQRSNLPLAVKLETMIQICEALAHAHREGIVHRDVKPSNLFLTNDFRAKVLDFGIARLPSSRLTIVGRVLGTPNYMAPEQILGNKSDGRADLFSAAVVFFELLVYHHPFQSALIPRRIVDSEPDSIFDRDSNAPLPFEQIFKKALHKDPEQRYATGTEFAADIRAVLEGVRLNASPTFSRVSLPSARSLPVEPIPETPIFNEAPEAGDPEEQRLSEFLRIIPYFEEAVDREAYGEASAALDQLRAIELVDARFVESVRLCESRLASIDPGANASDGPASYSISSSDEPEQAGEGDAKCAACGAMNRGGAAFCFECGARRLNANHKPPRDEGTVPVASTPGDGTPGGEPTLLYVPEAGASKPAQAAKILSAGAMAAPAAPTGNRKTDSATSWLTRTARTIKQQVSATSPGFRIRLAIFTGAAIVIIVGLMLMVLLRGPEVQPFLATARIGADSATLYQSRDSSRPIATVPQGGVVDLLEIPNTHTDKWLKAEWVVSGKPKAEGYVQRGALRDLDSKDGEMLLRLARTEGPGESGSGAELADQVAAYETVERRFPGTNAARAAAEESAKLNRALANLRALEKPIAPAADPGPEPGPAQPPTPPKPIVVKDELARARSLYTKGSYPEASRAIRRVLGADPHNKEALDLRVKVTEAQNAEKELH